MSDEKGKQERCVVVTEWYIQEDYIYSGNLPGLWLVEKHQMPTETTQHPPFEDLF